MFPVLQFFHSFHSKGMSCQDAWRLGKANKFVLLSASAYICPTFRIFNLKY